MSHKMYIEDKVVILNLWDTAGQERFKSLIPSYIKDSAVAIVIFDITNRVSFQSVEKWIEDARSMRDDEVLLVLAGNKCDLDSQRQVSTQEVEAFARSRNLLFIEISAKEGVNVVEMFNQVAKKLTGIETNPIKQSEIKNTGFSLEQVAQPGPKTAKEKRSKKTCAC